ncbi:hypothetical protein V2J09_005235 [Rumex salicifolius]
MLLRSLPTLTRDRFQTLTNLISWTLRKQRVVARLSTEAEYRALAYTSAELLWIKQLLQDLHVHLLDPPRLLCYYVGAQLISKNSVIGTRSKHIDLDFHFVREQIEVGDLRIAMFSLLNNWPMSSHRLLARVVLLNCIPSFEFVPHFSLSGVVFVQIL